MTGSLLLPILLGLPILGALILLAVPKDEDGVARGVGIAFSVLTFFASLMVWSGFDTKSGDMQLVFDKPWVESFGIHAKIGVDGISIWLVLLTTFLTPIILLSSVSSITRRVRELMICFLLLETGMLGAFLALDLFLFYVMWEVMLIPMYFIIGIWGGERRVYASIKFVIYTMVGSLLMLVAIFYLVGQYHRLTGQWSFDLAQISLVQLAKGPQMWCFLAFTLAFAIKVPLFPLHTWLPDAHVEAPTTGSVILAGVLLKLGIYGILRYSIPLFPTAAAQATPYLATLSVIGIVYGALVAFAQEDVKKLIAYSSVSHLAFCVLGVLALSEKGIEGAIFAMVSHGLTTGGLFLAIGVLYERRHTRRLEDFGGLWATMPVFGAFFLIITLGSAGLPGLSGFVGEFLCLIGTFDAGKQIPYAWSFTAIATTGVIFGAIYLLYMFQKVMFGPVTHPENHHLRDLSGREIAVFLPLLVGIFWLGVQPRPFLVAMEPAVTKLVAEVQRKVKEPVHETHLTGAPAMNTPAAPPTNAPTMPTMPVPPGGPGNEIGHIGGAR